MNIGSALRHPLKSRLFALRRLPSLFFWGIRVKTLDNDSCTVSIPYRWSTKNPFRSTYFAALSGAAEFSTGVLLLEKITSSGKDISYLIVDLHISFHKKATTEVLFTCNDGARVSAMIDEVTSTGKAGKITLHSEGVNAKGEIVARAELTWSLKERSRR